MKLNFKKYFTANTISALIVVVTAILLYFFCLRFDTVAQSLSWLVSVFKPFIWGFAIAYLINFLVVAAEKRLFYKIKKPRTQRVLAMLVGYTLAVIIVVLFLFMIIPQTVESIAALINNIPTYISNLITLVDDISIHYGWEEEVRQWLNTTLHDMENSIPDVLSWVVPYTMNFTAALSKVILNTFIAIVVSIYFIGTKEKYFAQTKKLLYAHIKENKVDSLIDFTAMANKTFSNFISGKLLDSLIIGVICFIVLSIFHFPFALLVSVIIGVTNIIPFFGPIIGAIPAFFIILIADPVKALWFPLFIIILQQIDGNIIGPKILGISIGISALWIVVAIVVGGTIFGFVGMVLGVPIFAIIYTLVRNSTNKRLEEKGLSTKTEDYASEENKIRF
ncbi:MAG: AI-2E family transporter [Bacillota bacterium]|nr:AI-2E family transporter [Bacillota bacterium]